MALFLSVEWIEALDHAAARSENLRNAARGRRIVMQQTISHKPDDRADYYVELDDGHTVARAGRAAAPDVHFRTDYATAAAISLGQDSAQAAFMRGRLHVDGDIGALLQNADLFSELDDVFAHVRSTTSY